MTLLMRDQENIEKGIEQEKIDTVHRMLKIEGINLEVIAQSTGLTIDEVAMIKDGRKLVY